MGQYTISRNGNHIKTCLICGASEEIEHHYTVDNYSYLKCTTCGLIFLEKQANTDVLYHSYIGTVWKKLRHEVTAPFRRFRHFRHFHSHMLRCVKVVEFVASQLGTEMSNQRIRFLDIGCNKGFVLANALSYGWDIYGVELVPELIAPFIRDHMDYRNQVYNGRFEDIENNLSD